MNKSAAALVLLTLVAWPQLAAADEPYVDGLVGAFGGMTVFPDNDYAGSVGPQADVVLGPERWHLRPLIGAGAAFNIGPAPHDFHLRAETGAAIRFLGGLELALGSVFIPSDGSLEWSTMYIGAKKSLLAAPIANPTGGSADSGLQFEVGPYFRYHFAVDDDAPTFPSAGVVFGISRE